MSSLSRLGAFAVAAALPAIEYGAYKVAQGNLDSRVTKQAQLSLRFNVETMEERSQNAFPKVFLATTK